MICDACLAPIASTVTRGPLTGIDAPPRIYHNGKPLAFGGRKAQIMLRLIKSGRASRDALMNVAVGLDADDPLGQLRIMITQIRQKLPPGIQITSLHGWGYELVIA